LLIVAGIYIILAKTGYISSTFIATKALQPPAELEIRDFKAMGIATADSPTSAV